MDCDRLQVGPSNDSLQQINFIPIQLQEHHWADWLFFPHTKIPRPSPRKAQQIKMHHNNFFSLACQGDG